MSTETTSTSLDPAQTQTNPDSGKDRESSPSPLREFLEPLEGTLNAISRTLISLETRMTALESASVQDRDHSPFPFSPSQPSRGRPSTPVSDIRGRLLHTPTNPRAVYQPSRAARDNHPRQGETPVETRSEATVMPQTYSTPRVKYALPERFDGDPSRFRTFYTHCVNYIALTDSSYSSDRERTGFVGQLLQGDALKWYEGLVRSNHEALHDYDYFLADLVSAFEDPNYQTKVNTKIVHIRQDRTPISRYIVKFRCLSAEVEHSESYLIELFLRSLNPELLTQLSYLGEPKTLEGAFDYAITADKQMYRRNAYSRTPDKPRGKHREADHRHPSKPETRPSPTPKPSPPPRQENQEPKSKFHGPLSAEEKKKRAESGACMYCGEMGHSASVCPKKKFVHNRSFHSNQNPSPKDSSPETSKNTNNSVSGKTWNHNPVQQFLVPVDLAVKEDRMVSTFALLDSGCSENFMNKAFAEAHDIPILPLSKSATMIGLEGHECNVTHSTPTLCLQIGNHQEELLFLIAPIQSNNLALGIPWLKAHNPAIDWVQETLTLDPSHEHPSCQSSGVTRVSLTPSLSAHEKVPIYNLEISLSPSSVPTVSIPLEYADFSDVFTNPTIEHLPEHSKFDLKIELQDPTNLPSPRASYNLPPSEKQALKNYVDDALTKGWIRPSKSPCAAGIFFVKKKDGGLRPCVDFRDLNSRTIKNKFPIPLISSMLNRFFNKKRITKVDLRNAFHQLRIALGDEFLTAFVCWLGHFEYLVVPFGLSNAPAALQTLMNYVLKDFLDDFVVVYLDDILIFSDTEEEHLVHVRAVLRRLREFHLYAKLEKCLFNQTTVEFLGFIISPEGIRLASDKLQTIRDWPSPTTLVELQSFLGFANYYRDAVRSYSEHSLPLTDLTQRTKKFSWTPEAEEAFKALKEVIISAPARPHPDFDSPFALETDASNFAMGCALLQKNESGILLPVLFHSRKFSAPERNYSVYDRELLAIVEAFSIWRHILLGSSDPIQVFTDHKNLLYFAQRRQLTPRHARWANILSEFNFELHYRPGQENVLADALSRHPALAPSLEELKDDLLQTLIPPERFISARGSTTKHESPIVVIDDPDLRLKIIQSRHDSPLGGHFGVTKTIDLISRDFSWDGFRKQVKDFVKSCEVCQRSKKLRHLPYGLLMPLPISNVPWDFISLDFIVKLPFSSGYDSIAVVVDRFTKMAHFIPCSETITSEGTATLLVTYVFKLHGLPSEIVSDRGPQFISKVWEFILKTLLIKKKLSTAYHPQTDGQTERTNQTLEQYLRCYVNYQQNNWSEFLPMAEFTYNNTVKPGMSTSPFFLNYGFHPRMDFLKTSSTTGVPPSQYPGKLNSVREIAHRLLLKSQETYTHYANKHRTHREFEVGDLVFVSTANFNTTRPSKKLDYRKLGPFPVLEKFSPVTYKIKLPKSVRVHPVFHVSLLEPAHKDTDPKRKVPPPPPVIVNSEVEWEVEEILDSRKSHHRLEYLVKWQGYDVSESTWESSRNLENSPKLVKAFHKKFPSKPAPSL